MTCCHGAVRQPAFLQGLQPDAPDPPSLTRFSPWLAIVAVYLVLGLVGRAILWARFGIEADVGAGRLPYIMTAGFINDLIESLYLFAPLALYILLAARPLVPVDCPTA